MHDSIFLRPEEGRTWDNTKKCKNIIDKYINLHQYTIIIIGYFPQDIILIARINNIIKLINAD
jgi:hypothetical protein